MAIVHSWAAWAGTLPPDGRQNVEAPDATATHNAPVRPLLHAAWTLAGFTVLLFHLHTRYPEAREFTRATPGPADTQAAVHFIHSLRRLPRPVLIPYHPWSAVLAGSPAHFHQHALSDIRAAGLPVPAAFTEGLKNGRWRTIVHDRHGQTFWRQWPGFTRHYRTRSAVGGRRLHTWAGNPCGPRTYWTPVAP
jgi:hypothetical protein